jgi:hypothetical protein
MEAKSEVTIKFSGELPTATPLQNKKVAIELIDVSKLNSSPVLTDDAVPQTREAENEQLDFPQTLLAAAVNFSSSTANLESESDESGQSETDSEQPQLAKKPAYKKLETATNNSGQTFTVKEKIEVSTSNFGTQKVFIISLYSAPDIQHQMEVFGLITIL